MVLVQIVNTKCISSLYSFPTYCKRNIYKVFLFANCTAYNRIYNSTDLLFSVTCSRSLRCIFKNIVYELAVESLKSMETKGCFSCSRPSQPERIPISCDTIELSTHIISCVLYYFAVTFFRQLKQLSGEIATLHFKSSISKYLLHILLMWHTPTFALFPNKDDMILKLHQKHIFYKTYDK